MISLLFRYKEMKKDERQGRVYAYILSIHTCTYRPEAGVSICTVDCCRVAAETVYQKNKGH